MYYMISMYVSTLFNFDSNCKFDMYLACMLETLYIIFLL